MRRLCALPIPISSRGCSQINRWASTLRYGSRDAPPFAWARSDQTTAVLYCKALIHASGGGRLARDWLAGWTALMQPSEELLRVALQHESTDVDVERLRAYFLERLSPSAEGTAARPNASPSGSNAAVNAEQNGSDGADAAHVPRLGASAEVRCFVYDAMTAACFHRYHKVPEEERQRLFDVSQLLGLDEDTTRNIWRVVEKEGAIAREKQRALEQPSDD